MCWFMGYGIDYVDVTIANRDHQGVIEVEDAADGLIVFKNGARASFWVMNYYSHDAQVELELTCENGVATITGEAAHITLNDGREFMAKPNPDDSFDYGGGPSYWGASHLKQITDYYQCLAEGKEIPLTGEEVLDTAHKMVMSLYESGRKKKVVKF
jgi:predicted dehydrogenase